MRSDTATTGRVRLVVTLSVLSAVMVMAGAAVMVASTAMHLLDGRPDGHARGLGAALAVAGLAVGLVTLLVFAFTQTGESGRRRRPAGHRHTAASAGPGRGRGRVLNPTSMYSPGGLIDVPRDAGVPGTAGAARFSGFSGDPRTMRPPRPGYQAGTHPVPGAGSGWAPPGSVGQPARQPMPPPGRMRPGEAFPPRDGFPRETQATRQAFPPREGQYPRPGPPRHGNPARDATAPGDSWRPGAAAPPSAPGHPSPAAGPGPFGPGPGRGTGRPPGVPGYGPSGYGPSGVRRPAPPGASAGLGPARPGRTFDGGYAQVIRPAEHPVPPGRRARPSPGRSAGPAGPEPDVYVYRDVSDQAPKASPRHPAADDTAYWYDLLAEEPGPRHEEARGPFEPLLSSGPAASGPESAPDTAGDEHREAPEQAMARRLEQLKDLYLTAEAIGEQNVDKHFDQLLARQRELISDYFRQSAAAQPGARDSEVAEAEPRRRQAAATDGQATPPEGASVRAPPPRAW